jgi:hypothetical protein
VTANRIARWDGLKWSPLGSGMNGPVYALAVLPNGDLVAGGAFTDAGGVKADYIARWDGRHWFPIGIGMSFNVIALAVLPSGDLVAGGGFASAGGTTVNQIARWNGVSWSPLGSGVAGGGVYALAVMPNGDVIAGGNFIAAGGVTVKQIARWDGTSWSPLGYGVQGDWDWGVESLLVLPNGDLIAGGEFTNASGSWAKRIARWRDGSWQALGLGTSSRVKALAALPNGELVAAGGFTFAGGLVANGFARWTETSVPWVAQPPVAQSSSEGETVTLTAVCASGYEIEGAVAFQWQRNGVDIVNGPGGASKGGGTVSGAGGLLTQTALSTTLTITNARASDAGEYGIVFPNYCGFSESAVATVTVTAPCPMDLSGDGTVGAQDLAALLSAWGTGAGDLNADGTTDAQDLAAMLGAWGACG